MVYGIANTDPIGVLVPTDATDRWIRGVPWHPEVGERLEDYDAACCTPLIRSAVGIPTLPVAIQAVQAFGMAAALAERYRVGRVLLVGDAAHIFPPTSGMGLNTAIQDGVVVARCLAHALQNSEAVENLDAYEAERRPVAEQLLASDLAAR
jgi:2-polyprenyl-6-methoxyphenol hydroxylase-like FAD-dependent oxidoreductase